jgi:hypothetical protein
MKPLRRVLERWAVPVLVRAACLLALLALTFTAVGILVPRPLPVMAGSSFGQGLILLALGCYTLAVLADSVGRNKTPNESQPTADDDGST